MQECIYLEGIIVSNINLFFLTLEMPTVFYDDTVAVNCFSSKHAEMI